MSRHLLLAVSAIALLALPVSASEPAKAAATGPAAPAPAAGVNADPSAALNAFFADYDKAGLERSPLRAAYRGQKLNYGKFDDQSDAAEIADHDFDMKWLADMRTRFAGAKLDPQAKLSYDLFEKTMARRDGGFKYRHNAYVFDQMNGAQSFYPAFLINIHRVDTKQDALDYVERLNGISTALDQSIAVAEARAQRGVMPPKWVYPFVVSDAQNIIKGAPFDGGADSALYADLKEKVGKLAIPQAEKDAIIASGRTALLTSVKPVYERVIAAMNAQEPKAGTIDGVWRFTDGAAFYNERLANYTTTAITAEQVHALGLQQVARIHDEMRTIMREVGFKGDLNAFFTEMRGNPKFLLPETAAGRDEYLAKANAYIAEIETKLPNWFGTLPKAALKVKAVEPFREKSAGKAFYQSPAPDGSRPGTYYVNLYKMGDMPVTEIEALAYHEGVPGHHLQLAIATELKDVPPFRKFGGYTAYSEGWGLYSEKLAKDMGQYRDPYSDFGRLQLELHRAVRLVVDSGIHYKKWSREDAIAYALANTAETPGAIEKAMSRYVIFPGQATAYMIGRLKITELRARAEAALGPKFDIKGFHDVVLTNGAVPLDVLETNVDAWIAARKA
ncbi:MAG: DUF885 domain-containing protein [Polymorphobacter sp.]